MKEIELKLLKAIHESTINTYDSHIINLLRAISQVIPSKMSSVWQVNYVTKTVSICAREKYQPSALKNFEFNHKIKGSLIGFVISEIQKKQLHYYNIPTIYAEPYWSYHKSRKRVKKLGLNRLVCIPIYSFERKHDDKSRVDALLNIYLEDDFEFSESLAEIIKEQFSLSISRVILQKREDLTRKVIGIYEQRGSKDLSSILYPIIHNILPKYFKYEACSIFIWDAFFNRLALSQTTGLHGNEQKSNVFYYIGEGLTGSIAELKKPFIIEDLSNISCPELKQEYIHKHQEVTIRPPKSYMCIPIMKPSRPDELIGVIRFVNKLNDLAEAVDNFTVDDRELVKHACNLIALYMEHEQSELERSSFAMSMAHEILTPAFSIRGTSSRLLRKRRDTRFPEYQVTKYLSDILDQSELIIALTNAVTYLWKGTTKRSLRYTYNVDNFDLEKDILIPSKKLVIPVARVEKLTFDNIELLGNYPKLYVDKFAFRQVFFNLFTNAIKYRITDSPEKFKIEVENMGFGKFSLPKVISNNNIFRPEKGYCDSICSGYLIQVRDYGRGIPAEEVNKIYLLGYRTKGIEKENVRGLGIGLTVVKKILDDFFCHIWVSKQLEPTTFNVLLPDILSNKKYTDSEKWVE